MIDRRLVLGLLLVLPVTLTGCGGGADTPPLGEVSGTVTLDGNPLPNATIRFKPEKGRESFGTTDESGSYQMQYTMDAKGALIGKHTVIISTETEGHVEGESESDEGTWVERTPETLPAKYNAESELSADVVAGSNTIDFDLKSE